MRDEFSGLPNAFLELSELSACFQNIHLPLEPNELQLLFDELSSNGRKLELKTLYARLNCWQDVLHKHPPDIIANLTSDIIKVERRNERVDVGEEGEEVDNNTTTKTGEGAGIHSNKCDGE